MRLGGKLFIKTNESYKPHLTNDHTLITFL